MSIGTVLHRPIVWYRSRSLRGKIFFWIATLVGVFIIISIIKGKPEDLQVETVTRKDLARTVLASGKVVSSTDLALSFQKGDIVRSIKVAVGDKVQEGQILAVLDNRDEAAAVSKAKAELLAAEARLRKEQQGTANEEVRKAEVALENIKRTQEGLVANARRKLFSDGLIAEPESGTVTGDEPVISGAYNGIEEGEYRISFRYSTNEIKFSGLERGFASVNSLPEPLGMRGLLISFPGGSSAYSYGDEWVVKIPNRDGENYTANLNAYNAALNAAKEAIADAEAELAIKKVTAPSNVDVALADVLNAQASVDAAQAELEQTIIRAPANGTITDIDIKLGQVAESFKSVISLQDVSNLYLEADINESNITNIQLGQPVMVTYDALDKSRPYTANVSSVDPAATIVDGIVNYKIKALISDVVTIKPGMTANLSIQTAFAPSVFVIPGRVITEENGEQSVQVIIDERHMKTERRVVTTGLRGDGGLVEITSGLAEGEKIAFSSK